MSHFLDRLTFFKRVVDDFSDGHGITTNEDRRWEDGYRKRWQHDKIVRSTHGANCTGSCSWKIYVKGGIVTWETQQTDYPRTRPDLPNHEPRGCSRGASYSWYLYSGNRVKYPLVRSRLLKLWREARAMRTPVAAWASIVEDPDKRAAYTTKRGHGGFVRATWDEVTEIIAAANAYTVKNHGPDRVIGFSPIPAMSMVSYAAGSRYLSLLGGVCMSFYDWYCDLPPSSPQTWGEQTDVPESADWYNSGFLILWGSNVPQTRTPDAHFYTEARYRGAKSVVICPDYSEASKFADLWISVKQGTDAALAMAMGHVILREFHVDRQAKYFERLCAPIHRHADAGAAGESRTAQLVPERLLRASDFAGRSRRDQQSGMEDRRLSTRRAARSSCRTARSASAGARRASGIWRRRIPTAARPSCGCRSTTCKDELADVAFPYFGNREHDHFAGTDHPSVLMRKVPAKRVHAGGRRGAGRVGLRSVRRQLRRRSRLRRRACRQVLRRERALYAGLGREDHRRAARPDHHGGARIRAQRREDQGPLDGDHRRGDEPLVPLRHELPRRHQHAGDVRLRRPIGRRLVALCRPGEAAPAIGLAAARLRARLGRPPRQMNSTSFFYAHTDQWRYETLGVDEILSPTAPAGPWDGALIDYNVRAERMGWLPSAPQLKQNPLVDREERRGRGRGSQGLCRARR